MWTLFVLHAPFRKSIRLIYLQTQLMPLRLRTMLAKNDGAVAFAYDPYDLRIPIALGYHPVSSDFTDILKNFNKDIAELADVLQEKGKVTAPMPCILQGTVSVSIAPILPPPDTSTLRDIGAVKNPFIQFF